MLKNKSKILFAALFVTIGLFVSNAALAQTDQEKSNCDTFQGYLGPLATGLPKFCSAAQILTWAISRLLVFAGTVTVLFLIIGGFFYVTAAGNEEQSEKGKKILVNSAIGLVIILMSATIVRIVAGTLTSSPTGGANSGASGQSQNSNTGTPGGGGQTAGSSVIALMSPDKVDYASGYTFDFSVPGSKVTEFCGSGGGVAYINYVKGQTNRSVNSESQTFQNPGPGLKAELNFDIPSPQELGFPAIPQNGADSSIQYTLYLCGQAAFQGNIGINSSGQSPSNGDLVNKATSLSFSGNWEVEHDLALDKESYNLVLTLNASAQDLDYLCSFQQNNKIVSVNANGQTSSLTLPLNKNQVLLGYNNPPTSPVTVKISVCGFNIGGAFGQSFNPP